MARFGPRADGPSIFGPGQAGPIYKRRTGPKWADGPSRAPEKPARAGPRPDTSLVNMSKLTKSYFNCIIGDVQIWAFWIIPLRKTKNVL